MRYREMQRLYDDGKIIKYGFHEHTQSQELTITKVLR